MCTIKAIITGFSKIVSNIDLRKSSRHCCVEALEGPADDVAKYRVLAARAAPDDVVIIADESGEGRHMRARLYVRMVLHILVKLWVKNIFS